MLVLSEQIKRANWTRLGRFEADRNLWETYRDDANRASADEIAFGSMSGQGQTPKWRRFHATSALPPMNGHRSTAVACPFGSTKRLMHRSNSSPIQSLRRRA